MLSHTSVLLLPHPISVQAAGRAIRQQAGGGGKKRRKQPKRAAAPSEWLKGFVTCVVWTPCWDSGDSRTNALLLCDVFALPAAISPGLSPGLLAMHLPKPCRLPAAAKRLAIIDSEDDFEDEASGPRRRRGRSGSAGGSSSLSGSEEEGSEGEESGLASDLSGDDSHDMEGGCRAALLRAVLCCAVLCCEMWGGHCCKANNASCGASALILPCLSTGQGSCGAAQSLYATLLQSLTPARRMWSASCGAGTPQTEVERSTAASSRVRSCCCSSWIYSTLLRATDSMCIGCSRWSRWQCGSCVALAAHALLHPTTR